MEGMVLWRSVQSYMGEQHNTVENDILSLPEF